MHLPTLFAFALFAYSAVSAMPLEKREEFNTITTTDVPAPLSRPELVLRAYLQAREVDEIPNEVNLQGEFGPLPRPATPPTPAWANTRIQPYRPSFLPPSGGGTSSWLSKWKAYQPQPASKKL